MSRDRSTELRGRPTPDRRKVARPPYDQLLQQIEETGYSAVGRKYGVSDNAVRKWVRFYESRSSARPPRMRRPPTAVDPVWRPA